MGRAGSHLLPLVGVLGGVVLVGCVPEWGEALWGERRRNPAENSSDVRRSDLQGRAFV